ncbi:hypothetical protein E2C01_087415 [Portunus trituberculatus]|uniref:Uncharacterized protein n=1 Tax=Portunus trituberculatus TaxID=210409 RepID=A0A5B7J811_PORTR|nr:hypothetical protein [Portunus trituberculatus]
MMDRVLRVDLCGYLLLGCGCGVGCWQVKEKEEEGEREEEADSSVEFSLLKAQIILKRYV